MTTGSSNAGATSTHSERSLTLLKTVAMAINLARTPSEALDAACAAILNFSGWHFSATFLPEPDGRMALSAFRGLSPQEEPLSAEIFQQLIGFHWPPGHGSVGRILASKQPEWVFTQGIELDDPKYPKAALSRRLGAETGFGFPIISSDRVLGVLIFYSRQRREPDPLMIELLMDIGVQLGRALEREEAQAGLRESEARYRTIFHGAIEGMYRTSKEGKSLLVNCALAEMLGYESPEEVVATITNSAKQVWVNPQERSRFTQLLEKQGRVHGFECQYRRKDGSTIWVWLSSKVVRAADGSVAYYEGFIEDITRGKQTEQQLQESLGTISQGKSRPQREANGLTGGSLQHGS